MVDDYEAFYELVMDTLTPEQQEEISDTRFLEICDTAMRILTGKAKFNDDRIRGQTVVGQELYDQFGRMIEVLSFRVGPTWDEEGNPTFEGYELCDGRGSLKLSIRSEAARIPKSQLGVS